MQIKKSFRTAAVILPIVLSMVMAQANDSQAPNQPNKGEKSTKVAQKRSGAERSGNRMLGAQSIERLKANLQKIGVNEGTIEKIADVTEEYTDYAAKQRIDLQKELLNIKEANLNNAKFSTIEPMVKRKSAIATDIELARIKRDMTIKSLLTPDEYDKWRVSGQRTRAKKDGSTNRRKNTPNTKKNG